MSINLIAGNEWLLTAPKAWVASLDDVQTASVKQVLSDPDYVQDYFNADEREHFMVDVLALCIIESYGESSQEKIEAYWLNFMTKDQYDMLCVSYFASHVFTAEIAKVLK